MKITSHLVILAVGFIICSCGISSEQESASRANTGAINVKVEKTEEEWKQILAEDQFKILRKAGTEKSYSGEYWDNKEKGLYICAGCGNALFSSATKFESGTGWPSFYEVEADTSVVLQDDYSLLIKRTEVVCAKCEGHLGHVFDDGPQPTGLRYCINSAALAFEKK